MLSYYTRGFLIWIWFLGCCALGLVNMCFHWRDPNGGYHFAQWVRLGAEKILGFKFEVENGHRLREAQPCVFVGNHQSNLDIFTYTAIYQPNTVVIGKNQLIWVPLFGLMFLGLGNIMINRKSKKHSIAGLQYAEQQVTDKKLSVWMFPEGTRNYGSRKLIPFKKGAFHLAVNCQIPIQPIVQDPLDHFFDPKKNKFGNTRLRFKVLETIPTKGLTLHDVPLLMANVRASMEKGLEELSASV